MITDIQKLGISLGLGAAFALANNPAQAALENELPATPARSKTGANNPKNLDPTGLAIHRELSSKLHRVQRQPWGTISDVKATCTPGPNGVPELNMSASVSMPPGSRFYFALPLYSNNGGSSSNWPKPDRYDCGSNLVYSSAGCGNDSNANVQAVVTFSSPVIDTRSSRENSPGNPYTFVLASPIMRLPDPERK